MSIKQKYSWNDFLKEHPEFKEKKTKRTSAEGKKAYESAYKSFIKKYLAGRAEKISKDIERATKRRNEFVLKLKALQKADKRPRARLAQKKAGAQDAAIARLARQKERTATLQKEFR